MFDETGAYGKEDGADDTEREPSFGLCSGTNRETVVEADVDAVEGRVAEDDC